jgi:hypothetical protein
MTRALLGGRRPDDPVAAGPAFLGIGLGDDDEEDDDDDDDDW